MKRQTSFFNASIFRSDVKRLWWVPVLHFISLVLFCVVPLWEQIEYIMQYDPNYFSYNHDIHSFLLIQYSIFSYIAACTVPVFLSMLLFSYLQKKNAVATAHAQPVTRKSLFVTHSAFGVLALMVPVILTGIIFGFIQATPGGSNLIQGSHIFLWMGIVLSYSFVIFALTTLIAMLTGHVVAQPIFTGIFALLPLFIVSVTDFFATTFWYGFYRKNSTFLQDIYMAPTTLARVPVRMLIYVCIGIVLFVAAYIVYRLRHLENHGEVVAFPKLKFLFIYCMALCSGILGEIYLIEAFDAQTLFWIIPFGILGLIIANMLSQKAFTLKGSIKPGVVFIVTVLAMVAAFQWDILGFESKVPNAEKIESVVYDEPYYVDVSHSKDGRSIEEKYYNVVFTDLQEIEQVIQLHQYKVENQDEHGFRGEFCLIYHLKNGTTLKRQYVIDEPSSKYIEAIWNTETYRKSKFPVLHEDRSPVEYMWITGCSTPFAESSEEDREIIRRMEEALQKDIQNTDTKTVVMNPNKWYVEFTRKKEWVYTDSDIVVKDENIPAYLTGDKEDIYEILPSYTHTIALLKELGMEPIFVGTENEN